MPIKYDNPLDKIYTFGSPARIVFGINALNTIGDVLGSFKQEKILLLTNKVIKETVPAKELISNLSSSGFKVKIFESEIKEPTVGMVNDFISFIRSEKKGIVIGMGGGSIMDQAKVASALAKTKNEVKDCIGVNKVPDRTLPLVLIPTTAGTGAETSKNAILLEGNKKLVIISPNILTDIAILDPVITVSLPPSPTAFTGMDALSHAIEAIMSLNCNPVTMAVALEAVSLINSNLPAAYFNGLDIQARFNMIIAATLGGFSLNTGVVLGHSVAYTLGHFGVPHGLGCAIALPHIMKFNAPVIPQKMDRIAKALGSSGNTADNSIGRASYAVNKVKHLNELLDIPLSLKSMGVQKKELKKLAEECFIKYQRPTNPRKYSEKDVIELYNQLWSGDLDL